MIEFDSFLAALANEPENVREMWQYALVLLMIADGRARVVSTTFEAGKVLQYIRTSAGAEFRIVRPEMSEATERMLTNQVRKIVEQESQK